MKEASSCPPEAGRQQTAMWLPAAAAAAAAASHSSYCLPQSRSELSYRASGQCTVFRVAGPWYLHGRFCVPVGVLGLPRQQWQQKGLWLIINSPVFSLLGRQNRHGKGTNPQEQGTVFFGTPTPNSQRWTEAQRGSVTCPPRLSSCVPQMPLCQAETVTTAFLSHPSRERSRYLPEPPLLPAPRASHCSMLTAREAQPWPPPSADSIWGSRAPEPPPAPAPREETACQAASACQILLLPNCETAAFKETLFWPPATPQTAWYNFIIKGREREKGLEEKERGERRKLLRPSQLVEYSAQRESGDSFPVGKLTPLIAHSVST